MEFIGFAFPFLMMLCIGYYLPSTIRNRTLSAESHAEDRFSSQLKLLDTSVDTNSRTRRGNVLVLGGKMQRPTAPKQRENADFLVAKEKYLLRRKQLQMQAKYRLVALLVSLGLVALSAGFVAISMLAWPWILASVGVTVICLIQSSYAGAMARAELADLREQLHHMGQALPVGRSISETEKRIKQLHQAKAQKVALAEEDVIIQDISEEDVAMVAEVHSETAEESDKSYENAASEVELRYEKATFTPAQLKLESHSKVDSVADTDGQQYLEEILRRRESAQMITNVSEYVAALPATEEVEIVAAKVATEVVESETAEAAEATTASVEISNATQVGSTWTPMRVPAPVYSLKQMARRRHVDAKELLAEHLRSAETQVPYRPKDVRNLGKETLSTSELVAQEVAESSLANVDSILEQRRAVGS